MRNVTLFGVENHEFVLLFESEFGEEVGIPSNRYMILHEDCSVLLDSGGFGVMPRVLAEMLRYAGPQSLKALLPSQNPGMASGMVPRFNLGSMRACVCEVWMRFLPNDGDEGMKSFIRVPDEGLTCFVSPGLDLVLVPEYFLHGKNHLSVYDPLSKVLFTSEIGAVIRPQNRNDVYVDDFASCLPYAEPVLGCPMHSRRAASWIETIAKLDVNVLAPRYGPVYRGQAVKDFLAWFRDLTRRNGLTAGYGMFGNAR